jgi:hypothetical protein
MENDESGPGTPSDLHRVLTDLAQSCAQGSMAEDFVLQLQDSTFGSRARQGQVRISRKLAPNIYVDFAERLMRGTVREQQCWEGARRWAIRSDNTYKMGACLAALQSHSPRIRNRAHARYRASVCAIAGEDGVVYCTALVSDDTQAYPSALLCGLQGAQLPAYLADREHADYLELVRKEAEEEGLLGCFPQVYAVDKAIGDINLWAKHAKEVTDAWSSKNRDILSPMGILLLGLECVMFEYHVKVHYKRRTKSVWRALAVCNEISSQFCIPTFTV